MSHHHYGHNAGFGCPVCGFPTGDYMPASQQSRWPAFGSYGQGYAPYPPAYPTSSPGPVHDKDILRLVSQYLRSDPRLSPEGEITVDASGGVVTLTGTVPDKWTKYFAGDDCFNIPVVVDVVNNLKIVEGAKAQKPRRPSKKSEQP